jgi:hypothetical protein
VNEICGRYWIAARVAEETPRKRAQRASETGSSGEPGSGKDGSGYGEGGDDGGWRGEDERTMKSVRRAEITLRQD